MNQNIDKHAPLKKEPVKNKSVSKTNRGSL